jgi:hypothetical protein
MSDPEVKAPASEPGAEPPAVKTEPTAPSKEDASPPAKPARVVLVKPDAKLSPRPAKKRDVEVQAEQPGFIEELWKIQREAIRAEVRALAKKHPYGPAWVMLYYNKDDAIDAEIVQTKTLLLEAEGLRVWTKETPDDGTKNTRGKPIDMLLAASAPRDPLLEPIAKPPSKQ